MKKETKFKILASLLPFVFLIILEIILRLVNYGVSYPLFKQVNTNQEPYYLQMNRYVAGKYFKDNDLRADNQTDLFLKTKTDSTFRIFVQGASTVVGFPYYRGGSFPRMLKHRLSHTFSNKNIEVINTGLTAVNSFTLEDFTEDIIKLQPDLVIIYAGHNEYYGALGAGSSISFSSHPALIRFYLSMKEFRFFQLIENTFYKFSKTANQKPSTRETTLMEVLAKNQLIPYDSEVYDAGIKQFQGNMAHVLKSYSKNNIPVLLSTVVSNEKDLPPFISDSLDEIKFQHLLNNKLGEAQILAQKNAKAAYLLAKNYLIKDQDSAKKYFRLAKELDYLRFRAPEAINEQIIELSEKYGATLVDMKAVFEQQSPNQIVGDELMTEHVHPNIFGQFLMADAFYEAIKEMHILKDWSHYIAYPEAIQDIPITKIDSIKGKMVIEELKQSWPYDMNMSGKSASINFITENFDEEVALAIHKNAIPWDRAMGQAYNAYTQDGYYEKALHVAQSLIFEYPEQGKVYQMAGDMSLKLDRIQEALFYYQKWNYLAKTEESRKALNSLENVSIQNKNSLEEN